MWFFFSQLPSFHDDSETLYFKKSYWRYENSQKFWFSSVLKVNFSTNYDNLEHYFVHFEVLLRIRLVVLSVLNVIFINFFFLQGRCNREKPPCKYFHPPQHLKDQLLINGRNHLALKNALMQQMGLTPGQTLVPGQVPTVVCQRFSLHSFVFRSSYPHITLIT